MIERSYSLLRPAKIGSIYFLRHQNILRGSERVRVELRD
jgi:hypothetical protein